MTQIQREYLIAMGPTVFALRDRIGLARSAS